MEHEFPRWLYLGYSLLIVLMVYWGNKMSTVKELNKFRRSLGLPEIPATQTKIKREKMRMKVSMSIVVVVVVLLLFL